MPVRIASPSGLTGLIDEVSSPAYASASGLLGYSQRYSEAQDGMVPLVKGIEFKGIMGKAIDWFKSFLP